MKNKNLEFFLEIYMEEIPARLVNDLSSQLKNNFEVLMNERGISFSHIQSYGTPMRLVLFINGLKNKTDDKKLEIWGPPENISISNQKEFLKPAESFIKKNNINKREIQIKERNGMNFLYCKKIIKGTKNQDNLKQITIESISKIKNKKFMRWSDKNFAFIRPIKNIFANMDKKFIKINFMKIPSENKIIGHRFSQMSDKKIKSFDDYLNFLKKSDVILDFESRKKKILDEIKKIEKKEKVYVNSDIDLINHVSNLTEHPRVLMGSFDKSFLKIPKEVINSIMKNHQKYFSVYSTSKMSSLVSKFIFVAGSPYLDNNKVVKGNEKVLAARLNDGKFFYEEDIKSGLEKIRDKIDHITFIEGIGSYGDKARRVGKLALKIRDMLGLNIDVDDIIKTSELCKADLASQMVFEFPELQGIMGGYYYLNTNKDIANSITNHYLPKTRDDSLPKDNLSKIISISDKLDTICSAFHMRLLPTGSSDPYGLRRCCIGIIRILEELDVNIDLIEIFKESFSNIEKKVDIDNKESLDKVKLFFTERIKNYYVESGYSVNILNAVVSNFNSLDIVKIKKKISVIKKLNGTKDLTKASEIFKRLKNIIKDNNSTNINQKLFQNKYEENVYSEILRIEKLFKTIPNYDESEKCLKEIIKSSSTLSNFFDNVMVMDKEKIIRANRLNLLTSFKKLISGVANFSVL
ncbi:MAG: glycine--tRNA ligase subunit beta [Thermodesulfobacteriota bacterium]|nr:glycine--tRNA ligase subunit beta [Thermodesulfobacteriota bacterium]